jgi:hypothetical protein
MDVFTHWKGSNPTLLRVWARSWESRGWKPRLLTTRNPRPPAGAFVVPCSAINFSRRPKRGPLPVSVFGEPGWDSAPVVLFPADSTEDAVLNCGRPL